MQYLCNCVHWLWFTLHLITTSTRKLIILPTDSCRYLKLTSDEVKCSYMFLNDSLFNERITSTPPGVTASSCIYLGVKFANQSSIKKQNNAAAMNSQRWWTKLNVTENELLAASDWIVETSLSRMQWYSNYFVRLLARQLHYSWVNDLILLSNSSAQTHFFRLSDDFKFATDSNFKRWGLLQKNHLITGGCWNIRASNEKHIYSICIGKSLCWKCNSVIEIIDRIGYDMIWNIRVK